MMNFKAILFDVIGTTVIEDDPELINLCFADAFKQNGIESERKRIEAVRGKNKFEAIVEMLGNEAPAGLRERIFQSFQQRVIENISKFHEHPQFENLVKYLYGRNVSIGVGSGLSQLVFNKLFEHLQWARHGFSYAATFDGFNRGRPDPSMILDMCSKLSLDRNAILKVGDTVADIEEGKNAGVKVAIILSGTQPRDLIERAAPDYVLISLSDLKRLL